MRSSQTTTDAALRDSHPTQPRAETLSLRVQLPLRAVPRRELIVKMEVSEIWSLCLLPHTESDAALAARERSMRLTVCCQCVRHATNIALGVRVITNCGTARKPKATAKRPSER